MGVDPLVKAVQIMIQNTLMRVTLSAIREALGYLLSFEYKNKPNVLRNSCCVTVTAYLSLSCSKPISSAGAGMLLKRQLDLRSRKRVE
jgi:hypothetical protein